jgi:spermidine synthase
MSSLPRRYGGILIHHGRDAEGALEVVDSHGVRALHFGTPPRQSAMSLTDPDRLELAYARAMLCALNFLAEPRRILVLGLGGGSLARFLLTHYPACQVDAVERRGDVVRIAHEYFDLPRVSRLAVHVGEAAAFVHAPRASATAPYDLILVDAYDPYGMDAGIHDEVFFRDCAALLAPAGVFSINLWGTHAVSLRQSLQWLGICFPGRCFRLPVPNRGNVIGLALGSGLDGRDPMRHGPHARELEMRLGLEFPFFLRHLRAL